MRRTAILFCWPLCRLVDGLPRLHPLHAGDSADRRSRWLSCGSHPRPRPRPVLGRRRRSGSRPIPQRPTRSSRSSATGFSMGLTVEGPGGRKWSAKMPPEAPTEVVASRLLWGLGYHQPPIYYVGQVERGRRARPESAAARRGSASRKPDLHGLDADDIWSYYTQPVRRHQGAERAARAAGDAGQLRSEGRAERALHADGAVRGGVALVRRARPGAVLRPHRRARRAARRRQGVRGNAVHQGDGRAVRPLRLSRPARRARRSDDGRRRPLDLRAARSG